MPAGTFSSPSPLSGSMKCPSLGMTSPSPILGSLGNAAHVMADFEPDAISVPVSLAWGRPADLTAPGISMCWSGKLQVKRRPVCSHRPGHSPGLVREASKM